MSMIVADQRSPGPCSADEPDRAHWYSHTRFAEIWRTLIQKNPFYATSELRMGVPACARNPARTGPAVQRTAACQLQDGSDVSCHCQTTCESRGCCS